MTRLLYFGSLPDFLGTASEEVQLPPEVVDVKSLLAWLRRRGRSWAEHLEDSAVQAIVNKTPAETTTPIKEGDEVAVMNRGRR